MPLPKVSQKYKNREARNRSLTPAQRRRRAAVGREERNRSQGAQDITVPRAPKAPVSRGTPAEQLATKFSAFAHRGKLTKDLGGGNYQNTKTGQSFKLNARGDHVYADGRTVKRRKTWRPNAPKGPAAL